MRVVLVLVERQWLIPHEVSFATSVLSGESTILKCSCGFSKWTRTHLAKGVYETHVKHFEDRFADRTQVIAPGDLEDFLLRANGRAESIPSAGAGSPDTRGRGR